MVVPFREKSTIAFTYTVPRRALCADNCLRHTRAFRRKMSNLYVKSRRKMLEFLPIL
jgi:hypothetical protein